MRTHKLSLSRFFRALVSIFTLCVSTAYATPPPSERIILAQVLEGSCKNVDRALLERKFIVRERGNLRDNLHDASDRTWLFSNLMHDIHNAIIGDEAPEVPLACMDDLRSAARDDMYQYWGERAQQSNCEADWETEECQWVASNVRYLDSLEQKFVSEFQAKIEALPDNSTLTEATTACADPNNCAGEAQTENESANARELACCEVFKERDPGISPAQCSALMNGAAPSKNSWDCVGSTLVGVLKGIGTQIKGVVGLFYPSTWTALWNLIRELQTNPKEAGTKLWAGLQKMVGIDSNYSDCLAENQKLAYQCEVWGNVISQGALSVAGWTALAKFVALPAGAAVATKVGQFAKVKAILETTRAARVAVSGRVTGARQAIRNARKATTKAVKTATLQGLKSVGRFLARPFKALWATMPGMRKSRLAESAIPASNPVQTSNQALQAALRAQRADAAEAVKLAKRIEGNQGAPTANLSGSPRRLNSSNAFNGHSEVLMVRQQALESQLLASEMSRLAKVTERAARKSQSGNPRVAQTATAQVHRHVDSTVNQLIQERAALRSMSTEILRAERALEKLKGRARQTAEKSLKKKKDEFIRRDTALAARAQVLRDYASDSLASVARSTSGEIAKRRARLNSIPKNSPAGSANARLRDKLQKEIRELRYKQQVAARLRGDSTPPASTANAATNPTQVLNPSAATSSSSTAKDAASASASTSTSSGTVTGTALTARRQFGWRRSAAIVAPLWAGLNVMSGTRNSPKLNGTATSVRNSQSGPHTSTETSPAGKTQNEQIRIGSDEDVLIDTLYDRMISDKTPGEAPESQTAGEDSAAETVDTSPSPGETSDSDSPTSSEDRRLVGEAELNDTDVESTDDLEEIFAGPPPE